MHESLKALVTCVSLLPFSVCDLRAATPAQKPLPPLVAEAPTTASKEMWEKYPQFFARFKDIWLTCPVSLELYRSIEIAQWYNENTERHQKMLAVCKQDKAHIPKHRSWPPEEKAAKARPDRYFSWHCSGDKCAWKQVR